MWDITTEAIYFFLQLRSKTSRKLNASEFSAYLCKSSSHLSGLPCPIPVPASSRSGVLLALLILNVPGMGGMFKHRLGSHGDTWVLACERRRIFGQRGATTVNRMRSQFT